MGQLANVLIKIGKKGIFIEDNKAFMDVMVDDGHQYKMALMDAGNQQFTAEGIEAWREYTATKKISLTYPKAEKNLVSHFSSEIEKSKSDIILKLSLEIDNEIKGFMMEGKSDEAMALMTAKNDEIEKRKETLFSALPDEPDVGELKKKMVKEAREEFDTDSLIQLNFLYTNNEKGTASAQISGDKQQSLIDGTQSAKFTYIHSVQGQKKVLSNISIAHYDENGKQDRIASLGELSELTGKAKIGIVNTLHPFTSGVGLAEMLDTNIKTLEHLSTSGDEFPDEHKNLPQFAPNLNQLTEETVQAIKRFNGYQKNGGDPLQAKEDLTKIRNVVVTLPRTGTVLNARFQLVISGGSLKSFAQDTINNLTRPNSAIGEAFKKADKKGQVDRKLVLDAIPFSNLVTVIEPPYINPEKEYSQKTNRLMVSQISGITTDDKGNYNTGRLRGAVSTVMTTEVDLMIENFLTKEIKEEVIEEPSTPSYDEMGR